jgi:glyoxylase-like metal-dependent hydrolase (beta-lactamase superfamily II)
MTSIDTIPFEKPEEIYKDIYLIKIPLPGNPLKNTNSYFIKGENRNLLIDTAFNRDVCLNSLKKSLAYLSVDLEKTDLFLTHLHSDHTGLAGDICSPNRTVFMGEKDSNLMLKFYTESYWETVDARFIKLGFTQRQLDENKKNNPASIFLSKRFPLTPVNDGDTIEVGDYTLKCIETPGHTPGHMCLYIEKEGLLFSGDHIIFDITPNIAMWSLDDHSLEDYINSLLKVKNMTVKETFSGHRKHLGDCHNRIDDLIAHHTERLAEVMLIYKEASDNLAYSTYDIASKMTWSIRAKDWDDFPLAQKWFAVSEAGSHLEYLRHQGKLKRKLVGQHYLYSLNA